MGSRSRSTSSSQSETNNYQDYSTENIDNSATEYNSNLDNSYTDRSRVSLYDDRDLGYSYSSVDSNDKNFVDNSDNSVRDLSDHSIDYNSDIDNSYTDNSDVRISDSSRRESSYRDESNNSVNFDYNSSIDNSYRDLSTVSLTDSRSNLYSDSSDSSLDYNSSIDNSSRDNSRVSIADNSSEYFDNSYDSKIDASTQESVSIADNSYQSYVGDSQTTVITDGGALDAMRDVAMGGFAWGEELTGRSLSSLESFALSAIDKNSSIADKGIDAISGSSRFFLSETVDALNAANDRVAFASGLVSDAQQEAFGEALLSSRDAFGNALGFANSQQQSDSARIQAAADKNQKMLFALAAIVALPLLLRAA